MEAELKNREIRALSWKQPYADLMFYGKIETRKWYTRYRGLVLICSSKKGYTLGEEYALSGEIQWKRLNGILNENKFGEDILDGAALYVGELVDCYQMTPSCEDKCFVKYSSDLFCHVYQNIRKIQPFAYKGCQGWKILSDEVKEKIKFV